MNDLSKFLHIAVPVKQLDNLFQGIPTSLELDNLQQKQKGLNESNIHLQGRSRHLDGTMTLIDEIPMQSSVM
ncbi:hypothetical protein, partial [Streptococcus anginosus]|uniref:hypothetical protein n=1 Tax=Streptococcus anginosus TaxID=1328 RepID=UPI002ED842DD